MNKNKVMNMAHSAQIRGQQAGREYEQYREVYLYILHKQIRYMCFDEYAAGRPTTMEIPRIYERKYSLGSSLNK